MQTITSQEIETTGLTTLRVRLFMHIKLVSFEPFLTRTDVDVTATDYCVIDP